MQLYYKRCSLVHNYLWLGQFFASACQSTKHSESQPREDSFSTRVMLSVIFQSSLSWLIFQHASQNLKHQMTHSQRKLLYCNSTFLPLLSTLLRTACSYCTTHSFPGFYFRQGTIIRPKGLWQFHLSLGCILFKHLQHSIPQLSLLPATPPPYKIVRAAPKDTATMQTALHVLYLSTQRPGQVTRMKQKPRLLSGQIWYIPKQLPA